VSVLACLIALMGGQAVAALPELHVADGKIRDSHNRQVTLRGVNVTALTDQYQVDPDLPTVVPLRGRDYRKMEKLGFNVIRLAITWSSIEPHRGVIDTDYIDKIRKVVDKAADHGIYTVIDMHNGGWGKYVATPPGENCPGKESRRSHGWLGAPEWATFTDGKSTCHDDKINKRTEAVKAAWTNWWHNHREPAWLDGLGIQDHLVRVWGVLARSFAHEPAVAGYDLLNEADPGNLTHDQQAFTTRFTADAIDEVRRSEAQAGGFNHLILFEPNLTWSQAGLASHSPAPGFSNDPNLVFAPHLYGRDVHTTSRAFKLVKRDLRKQERRVAHRAREYGAALWIGEWSFSIFDESALKKLRAHIEIQDANELGSAWWQWKVACGAPQRYEGMSTLSTIPVVGNLNPTKCPSGKPVRRPKGWRAIIGRAYPEAAPGSLTELSAHGSRLTLKAKSGCDGARRAADPEACRLEVWIPKKNHDGGERPHVKDRHLRDVLVRKVPGGWRLTADVTRSYVLKTD
jgi:endoglycosylceramidase